MLPRRASVPCSLIACLALIVTSCGGQSVSSPSGAANGSPGTSAASSDPAFAALLADALAQAGQPAGDLATDQQRADLLTAMGVPTALGSDADRILALVAASEAAARSQQPIPPAPPSADGGMILAAFRKFPGLTSEFRAYMAGGVRAIGFSGADAHHFDLGIASNTQKEGTLSATSQVHTTIDVSFGGSDVKARFDTDIQNHVTDTTTGYPVFTETTRQAIAGELDACPNAAGLVPGSLDRSIDEDASTFPAAGGGGGSRATGHAASSSQFHGTVDDTATLGRVSQTYTHDQKFKRTASADGGPAKEGAFTLGESGINDGVPTDNSSIGARTGDWSGATQTKAERSGDATAEMIDSLRFDAGYDWATMEASYIAAQQVWRDSRCVIVTAPGYIAASEFAFNQKPTHKEDVDKGSTTQFEVGLDHRYKQAVTAKITAKLDGKETLSPEVIPKPPGRLTYVAPDQNGQTAKVQLESISRQGIGRLTLSFHTGSKRLKVSIDGTMTSTVGGISYSTSLHASNILLSKTSDPPTCSDDGITCTYIFAGSGPATAQVVIPIPDCSKPYVEKGPFKLKATNVAHKEEGSGADKWEISWDPSTTLSFKGGLCVGLPIDSFMGTGDAGPLAGFMTVLGNLKFEGVGGKNRVQRTVSLGASTNVIDATVTAEVVSE